MVVLGPAFLEDLVLVGFVLSNQLVDLGFQRGLRSSVGHRLQHREANPAGDLIERLNSDDMLI